MRFRFRRFRTRLLVLIAGLVALVQGAGYLAVTRVNRHNAVEAISENLGYGARLFERLVQERLADNQVRAQLMTADYALRQLFIKNSDQATIKSALLSYQLRFKDPLFGTPLLVLLGPTGPDYAALADTGLANPADWAPFRLLAARAEADQTPSGYALIGGRLHLLLVVPVLAPAPEVAAWLGIALPIDKEFASQLRENSRLDVTFAMGGRKLLTTLSDATLAEAAAHTPSGAISQLTHGGLTYLTSVTDKPLLPDVGTVQLVLQRSLDEELAPVRLLEEVLLLGVVAALGAAGLLALWLARTVSQPVQALAAHTQVIARGDYATRLALRRADELGQLADAFNTMSSGLAERDRVRDLLDKNVSPEVAAQLLREGSALGGEEREVTVLFADLRGFTPLAERLPPRELVTLLNRYLDRMSRAIEAEGGVIDKFIGDEIMALFGAPVAAADSADRALRAALAMRAALAAFNRELAAEGRPTLAFGIGINTARVVAGNIGSHRRLNYSVIGDGVNTAARLQTLTRQPGFETDILLSEATLQSARGRYTVRDLGAAQVKGRSETVRVLALEAQA